MRTNRLLWFLLVSLLTQLPIGCHRGAQLSNFVSDGGQTYFEIKDAELHKVYTREISGLSYVAILDVNNVPEVEAWIDSVEGRAFVMEYRGEPDVTPPGLRLLDVTHMSRIGVGDAAFARWKSKFAVFTVSSGGDNKTFKAMKAGATPLSIKVGNTIVAQKARLECGSCNLLAFPGCCLNSACSCSFRFMCEALRCALDGNAACFRENQIKANACIGISGQVLGQGAGRDTMRDLILTQTNGIFSLAR